MLSLKSQMLRATRTHGRQQMIGSNTLYKLAKWYSDSYENHDHDMQSNGEQNLIRTVSRITPKIIFDVGANVGHWTRTASTYTNATIHCFEPAPDTFQLLKKNTEYYDRIIQNNFALGKINGTVQLKYYPNNTGISTTVMDTKIHSDSHTLIDIDVQCGARYVKEKDIDFIDFLKIDVEGA